MSGQPHTPHQPTKTPQIHLGKKESSSQFFPFLPIPPLYSYTFESSSINHHHHHSIIGKSAEERNGNQNNNNNNDYNMSEAYERERQNNSRLDELASKVTSLRDVTINIYDNARDHEIIDNSNEVFANFTTGLKQSAGRITRMAATGSKGQTIKLAGVIVGGVIVLYLLWGLFF